MSGLFIISERKPFFSAVQIITFAFLIVFIIFTINKKIFIAYVDKVAKNAKVTINEGYKENDYAVYFRRSSSKIDYYKYYYFPQHYCAVDRRGHVDFSSKSFLTDTVIKKSPHHEIRIATKVPFLEQFVCYDLFGTWFDGSLVHYPKPFFGHVGIMGFYSSIILNLIIFMIIKFKFKKDTISLYGFILIGIIFTVPSVISLFWDNLNF